MIQKEAPASMGPDAFLAWEHQQRDRYLYVHGEVHPRSIESPRHLYLAARLILRVGTRLRGRPFEVHASDLQLGLNREHFVYADAVVACEPVTYRQGAPEVMLNPRVVFEVLSRVTERYDRGEKQAGYLGIASLQHLVMLSQRGRRVEVYTRQGPTTFQFQAFGPGSTIELPWLDMTLDLDDLYEGAFELPGDESDDGPSSIG